MKSLIPAIKRVSVSEDGSYAVGPSLAAIQTYLSGMAPNGGGEAGLGIVTVYACVRLLAETIASLPLVLYRNVPGGGKKRAIDHPLYETFHDEPNPDMTSLIWRELLVSHVAGWGNHYSEKVYDGLGRLQFWPIRPDRVEAKFEDGRKVYDYLSPSGGRTRFRDGTIFHVRGLSSDGLVGYSPIALHRQALLLATTAQEYGTNFLANGARPAVVLSHPKNLSPGAIDRLAGQVDQMRGSRNAGKTIVLEEGLTITEVGIAPEDAQYIETRRFQMQEIARMYRVPPHMIGDLERATFDNIEHQSIDFVVHTIRPWLVRIEQEIKSQVLADEPDLSVEFLVDGLLRGDAKSRAEALAIQRQHGIINGNEWRALENLNPIEDGSGTLYWMAENYRAAMTPADVEAERAAVVAPPVEVTSPPQLSVIKSAEVRCQSLRADGRVCNNLIVAGLKGSWSVATICPRCKASVVQASKSVDEAQTEDPMAAMYDFMARTTKSQGDLMERAVASATELATVVSTRPAGDVARVIVAPPDVHLDAPIVNVPPPDTGSFVAAIADLKAMLATDLQRMAQPRNRRIERDADGRIIGLVEE